MVVFPNAKINLGLHIVSKRADGYHNLETCFIPIPLRDILEIIEGSGGTFQFSTSGLAIPGKDQDNLCVRAYQLLKADFDLPPIQMHLHKIIPMGGGLGGGSSDASFALRSLNELFKLSLDNHQLEKYASQLGSDCPFFIRNHLVLATGTGNQFRELSTDISGNHIALIFPNVAVTTAKAYAQVIPREVRSEKQITLAEILETVDPKQWKEKLVNDFESSVFAQYPSLQKIKNKLYEVGAFYASMSGSGSTLYGLFDHIPDLSELENGYQIWQSAI